MAQSNSDKLKTVVAALRNLSSVPPAKQVSTIRIKFLPRLEFASTQADHKVRPHFAKVHNLCSSLADGIADGVVKKREFLRVVADVELEATRVLKVETTPQKEKASPDDLLSDSGVDKLKKTGDRAAVAMQKYAKYEHLVPKTMRNKFSVIRLPIVVLTDPWLVPEKLAAAKLSDDNIFGYPFIKDQLLLGMSSEWIRTEFRSSTPTAADFALQALHAHMAKANRNMGNLTIMGTPKIRGQVTWVWVCPDKTINTLQKAAVGGHFKLQSWDFPFEVDRLKGN